MRLGMISIRRNMDRLSETDLRLEAAVVAYTRVLGALENAGGSIAGGAALHFQQFVAGARGGLNLQTAATEWARRGQQTEQEIASFAGQVAALMDHRDREYKALIRVVADAAGSMAQNGADHSAEVQHFARRVEAVGRLENLTELRHELTARVADLQNLARRLEEDGAAQGKRLAGEITQAEQRMRAAEELAVTDDLTGLGNRRKAETAMHKAIENGRSFNLLLFDLNGFKAVNDGHGHLQGDRLLAAVATRMRQNTRAGDRLCRWGGDEFVVILPDVRLPAAHARGEQLLANGFGEFMLPETAIRVHIGASIGIAEHLPGESAGTVFARADELLYQQKACRPGVSR